MMTAKHAKRVAPALALATVAFVVCALWMSAPSYSGRSIRSWFYDTDKKAAGEAFRAVGQATVPFLIHRLEDGPSHRIMALLAKVFPSASAGSPSAGEIYRQRKVTWQCRAAYLLGELAVEARAAETHLASAATSADWSLRGAATVALMKIRQEPPDSLIERLRDTSDGTAWYQNAMMVGQFGLRAEPAIPILLDGLQHSNRIIQAHALLALGMIAGEPDECVPAIVPFLASPSVGLRGKATWALRSYGTNALSAKTAISKALHDSDPWIREQAEIAMKTFEQNEISR